MSEIDKICHKNSHVKVLKWCLFFHFAAPFREELCKESPSCSLQLLIDSFSNTFLWDADKLARGAYIPLEPQPCVKIKMKPL